MKSEVLYVYFLVVCLCHFNPLFIDYNHSSGGKSLFEESVQRTSSGFVLSDFVYGDFNETTGLTFVGDAATTVCKEEADLIYGDVQGLGDVFNYFSEIERSEGTDFVSEVTMNTNKDSDLTMIEKNQSGFLHRSDSINAPTSCAGRLRLTPSGPTKKGAVWYVDSVPVNNGFETSFTFQISDQSKECTERKDAYFNKRHYLTCSVRGADGFAFVIQRDPNATNIVGNAGGHMGFGGVRNSLAIAFDTWPNPGLDQIFSDQVKFQSMGEAGNDGLIDGLLGLPKAAPLADGKIHRVKIVYYGYIVQKYFTVLVANERLTPYLKDNGEQKRVGTLVVFIDEGITNDEPLMAMPINLSLLLNLPDDKAFVGFTSATGRFYSKHDILAWHWCDQEPCDSAALSEFDYHQTSRHSAAQIRMFEPGAGFGGGDVSGFPTKNKNPDTSPWDEPTHHFSKSRTTDLSPDADKQVPPNTDF